MLEADAVLVQCLVWMQLCIMRMTYDCSCVAYLVCLFKVSFLAYSEAISQTARTVISSIICPQISLLRSVGRCERIGLLLFGFACAVLQLLAHFQGIRHPRPVTSLSLVLSNLL